ncbi:MAG: hypothetical protein AAFX93_12275 [Verrucomicrobiota bacterium]
MGNRAFSVALLGVLVLGLMLAYNAYCIALDRVAPFTPWEEMQTIAALAIAWWARGKSK